MTEVSNRKGALIASSYFLGLLIGLILYLITDQLMYVGLGAALGTIFAGGAIASSKSKKNEDSEGDKL